MRFGRFFVDRPRFAFVLALVILLAGGLAYPLLPVTQYPDVVPPTVIVTAHYPGADPQTIADTVAAPLEQEINGVEDMLYIESSSTADGAMSLKVTFKLGTDVDKAQVLVQNRVAIAAPRLPAEVRQIGITTEKSSPSFLLIVHLLSPDGSKDALYLSNYAFLQIKDGLARIDGVGAVQVFGGSPYSMRVWLDIERLSSLQLTPGDVIAALSEQNAQVAAGSIGKQPNSDAGAFEIPVSSTGRLRDAEEFGDVILKRGQGNALVRLKDVARIEIGAQDYTIKSSVNGEGGVAILLSQRSGSNAIATAHEVVAAMDTLAESFPPGVEYSIGYNPTEFVEESIDEVYVTLLITAILVALTVFVFLQGWRATLIPVVAIPISLVGAFAVMYSLGVSLNNLSLFGLVLAIGIVVDDAIVVVENVDRLLKQGLSPKEAAGQAMDEVGSALVATTLVLLAVFLPTAFISGISGQFYRQFALTISAATLISTFVSLTLSPAMASVVLQSEEQSKRRGRLGLLMARVVSLIFSPFNKALDVVTDLYAATVRMTLRFSIVILLTFGGLLFGTYALFQHVPTGFIPPQDQGYLIVSIQLPEGASLPRTEKVTATVTQLCLDTPGIDRAEAFSGFSGATFAASSSAGAIFATFDDATERAELGHSLDNIVNDLRQRVAGVADASVFVFPPPPVEGIGTGGGFQMQIQDRGGQGIQALNDAAWTLAGAAGQEPGLVGVFSSFSTGTPELRVNVDEARARLLDVPISNINEALQAYLGSVFVNEFNYLGRSNRVTVQADAEFRDEESDILRLQARSASGAVVPMGSVVTVEKRSTPARVVRYNLYPAADVSGDKTPSLSTGQSLDAMERLASEHLPPSMGYEWTGLAYQERSQGNTALLIFGLSVLLAFLALTAQYESWILPLAVVLIVPLCLLFGLGGVALRGMDNNILVQIGFVLLVGLACKNAILIVEFAKAKEDEGLSPFDAVIEACRLRLRPILMTALSFILGVLPLVFASGAGSEMRQALGTAVFSGMVGVTVFGLLLTPVFYVTLRRLAGFGKAGKKEGAL